MLFNPQTARLAAQRSAQSRRDSAQRLVELSLRTVAPVSVSDTGDRLVAIGERIDRTRDANELDSLTRAYERLFRVWQVLTRTPNPGQLRPSLERDTPRRTLIVDAESAPVSAPHPPPPPEASESVM